mmetsp:Transcript_39314/g.57828  ORF Transcript_39314/g.57828 Transcript_39314/m.57828 type:complete len:206 (-) Transcript_39314:1536-2153(-)
MSIFYLKKNGLKLILLKNLEKKSFGLTLGNKSVNVSKTIESLKNRNYKVNLNDIKSAEDSSHKKLTFKCYDYDEKNCLTGFCGLDTSRDKFFSMVRKWQTIIETNSDIRTKDGYFLRIFLVAFSRKRRNQTKKTSYIKASHIRTIRRKMNEILIKEGAVCLMKDLIPKLISEKLVDEIGFYGSKIYPLQNVIIKKVKVLDRPSNF